MLANKQKKTYRVIGGAPAFGTDPGKTFERALTPEQEKRMISRGSIEVVSGSPAPSGDGGKQPDKTPAGKE